MPSSTPSYYIDSCLFIRFLERTVGDQHAQTVHDLMALAEKGGCRLVTSTFTITEVYRIKSETDKKAIDPEVTKAIDALWNPGQSPVQLVDVHRKIAHEACYILRAAWDLRLKSVGGKDGVHLATAKRESVDALFTLDPALMTYSELVGYPIEPPHLPVKAEPPTPDLFRPAASE